MKSERVSRRYFFYGSLLAGAVPLAGFGSEPSLKSLGYKSPNEKLQIASIGAGGKARSDIAGCAATEDIVALCDVDDKSAAKTFAKYPNVPKFKDYRVMLDKQSSNFDAVIVTIPDHMHAAAAIDAMSLGKHVYVQKPLAHTVWECRELLKAAEKYKVATQMGNQGYSNEGTRQCAEMIWRVRSATSRKYTPGRIVRCGRKANCRSPPSLRFRRFGLGPVARRRTRTAL